MEQNPLAPSTRSRAPNREENPLAPSTRLAAFTPEEEEILSVCLFVEIIRYEFKREKGYQTKDWKLLFKYWYKYLASRKHWNAEREKKIVNYIHLLKQGVISIGTQERLYGNQPWYLDLTSDEKDEVHAWLKTLEPEDVQYTLWTYYDQTYNFRKKEILRRYKVKAETKEEVKRMSVIRLDIVETVLAKHKTQLKFEWLPKKVKQKLKEFANPLAPGEHSLASDSLVLDKEFDYISQYFQAVNKHLKLEINIEDFKDSITMYFTQYLDKKKREDETKKIEEENKRNRKVELKRARTASMQRRPNEQLLTAIQVKELLKKFKETKGYNWVPEEYKDYLKPKTQTVNHSGQSVHQSQTVHMSASKHTSEVQRGSPSRGMYQSQQVRTTSSRNILSRSPTGFKQDDPRSKSPVNPLAPNKEIEEAEKNRKKREKLIKDQYAMIYKFYNQYKSQLKEVPKFVSETCLKQSLQDHFSAILRKRDNFEELKKKRMEEKKEVKYSDTSNAIELDIAKVEYFLELHKALKGYDFVPEELQKVKKERSKKQIEEHIIDKKVIISEAEAKYLFEFLQIIKPNHEKLKNIEEKDLIATIKEIFYKKALDTRIKIEETNIIIKSNKKLLKKKVREYKNNKNFMSLSDVKECKFVPVTGSSVPKKHLNLAFKNCNELRNIYNPDDPPNFDKWVDRLGKNLVGADPYIHKEGMYKRAKALYMEGNPDRAKEMIVSTFNMPCILDHFEPGKPRNIYEKPLEDFQKNIEILELVYILYVDIRRFKRDLFKQIKALEAQDKQLPQKKHHRTFMCPLKEKCPNLLASRNDDSNISQCKMAHHAFELSFARQEKAKQNARNKLIHTLKETLKEKKKKPAWVPNGQLVDCVGCHQNFLYKPLIPTKAMADLGKIWSRSLSCFCNKCAVDQRLKKKQQYFIEKSKEVNKKLEKKISSTQKAEDHTTEKLGLYRKTLMLYKCRRLKAAFDCSCKAIEKIRNEREEEKKEIESKTLKVKKKVGLDSDFSLNDSMDFGKSLGSTQNNATIQQVELFKQQQSRLTQQTSKDFLNYQIEKLHLEIKNILDKESQLVERLRDKAEELTSGELHGTGYYAKPNKIKMCPRMPHCKKGTNCEFAHFANQLDFVSKTRVAKNLNSVAECIEEKVTKDILREDWKQWKLKGEIPKIEADPPIPTDLTINEELYKLPFQSYN